MMVVNVRPEMLGKVTDPGTEQRYLDFGRPGVAWVSGVIADNLRLVLGG